MLSWLQEAPDAEAIGPAEPAEVGPSRPLQRHSLVDVAAQSAAVARHHGQKAGLRHGW